MNLIDRVRLTAEDLPRIPAGELHQLCNWAESAKVLLEKQRQYAGSGERREIDKLLAVFK